MGGGFGQPQQQPFSSYGQAPPQQPVMPSAGPVDVAIGGLAADATEDSVKNIFAPYCSSLQGIRITPGAGGNSAVLTGGMPQQAEWLIANLNGNMPVGLTSP